MPKNYVLQGSMNPNEQKIADSLKCMLSDSGYHMPLASGDVINIVGTMNESQLNQVKLLIQRSGLKKGDVISICFWQDCSMRNLAQPYNILRDSGININLFGFNNKLAEFNNAPHSNAEKLLKAIEGEVSPYPPSVQKMQQQPSPKATPVSYPAQHIPAQSHASPPKTLGGGRGTSVRAPIVKPPVSNRGSYHLGAPSVSAPYQQTQPIHPGYPRGFSSPQPTHLGYPTGFSSPQPTHPGYPRGFSSTQPTHLGYPPVAIANVNPMRVTPQPIQLMSSKNMKTPTSSRNNVIHPLDYEHLPKKERKENLKKTSESRQYAPAKLHFIWVGDRIKPEYLRSLKKIAKVAERSGFEITLWVNDPLNYHKTALACGFDIPNLKVRHINELYDEAKKIPGLEEKINLGELSKNINRELLGFKNLASAADLLRLLILYIHGGYYFDLDREILIDDHTTFKVDELPMGIKLIVNFEFSDSETDILQVVSSANIIKNRGDINDLMAAMPRHPVFFNAINSCNAVYAEWDNNNTMGEKRFPFFHGNHQFSERYQQSLRVGPAPVSSALIKCINESGLEDTPENKKALRTITLPASPILAGVQVIQHNDLLWAVPGFDMVLLNDPGKRYGNPYNLVKFHDAPVLIKTNDGYQLFGYQKFNKSGGGWRMTKLNKETIESHQLPWPKGDGEAIFLKADQIPRKTHIACTEGHHKPYK